MLSMPLLLDKVFKFWKWSWSNVLLIWLWIRLLSETGFCNIAQADLKLVTIFLFLFLAVIFLIEGNFPHTLYSDHAFPLPQFLLDPLYRPTTLPFSLQKTNPPPKKNKPNKTKAKINSQKTKNNAQTKQFEIKCYKNTTECVLYWSTTPGHEACHEVHWTHGERLFWRILIVPLQAGINYKWPLG